jgi:hypothetical protein
MLDVDILATHGVAHGLIAFLDILADHHLFDHTCPLLHHRLLGRFRHLEVFLTHSVQILFRRGPVHWPPLYVDAFFTQANVFLHRLFRHAGMDSHAATLHLALTDLQFLLNDRHRHFALVLLSGAYVLDSAPFHVNHVFVFNVRGCTLAGLPLGCRGARILHLPFRRALVNVDWVVTVHDIGGGIGHVVTGIHGHECAASPHAFLVIPGLLFGYTRTD